jgi:hypothetical protein
MIKSFKSLFKSPSYDQFDLKDNRYDQDYEFQNYSQCSVLAKYSSDPQIIIPYKSLPFYYDNICTQEDQMTTFIIECGKYPILNDIMDSDLDTIAKGSHSIESGTDGIDAFIEHVFLYNLLLEGANRVESLSWADKYELNILKFEDVPEKYVQSLLPEQVQLMTYKWIKFRLEELKVATIQTIEYLKSTLSAMEPRIAERNAISSDFHVFKKNAPRQYISNYGR